LKHEKKQLHSKRRRGRSTNGKAPIGAVARSQKMLGKTRVMKRNSAIKREGLGVGSE